MIGLDTNVLVRHLVQDDSAQAERASRLIESLNAGEPGYVSVVVMAEIVWVLQRGYGLGRGEVAAVIERLLATDALVVEHEQAVFAAMTALRDGHGDFADALIGALASEAGCTRTVTFDRGALRLPGFVAVP